MSIYNIKAAKNPLDRICNPDIIRFVDFSLVQ